MRLRSAAIFACIAYFVMEIVVSIFATSCAHLPPDVKREQARAAVETTTVAVRVLDESCARVVTARQDKELGRVCKEAYTAARASLLGVAEGIDTWDEHPQYREDITCGVWRASQQADVIARELAARELAVPPIYQDAQRLVATLGGCHAP